MAKAVIGITGEAGSGKTEFSKFLEEIADKDNYWIESKKTEPFLMAALEL